MTLAWWGGRGDNALSIGILDDCEKPHG